MSAITAPIGRRRTQAAICSGVASAGQARGQGYRGWRRCRWVALGGGRQGAAARRGVQAGGVADDPGFECLGAEEAAGDVREDHGDICGAERVGVVAERGGKVSAVVDERTDESEEAAGAAGFGVGGGLGGGHVGQMSMGPGLVARNFFLEEFRAVIGIVEPE